MPPIASDTGTLSSQYRSSGPSSGLIRKNNELFNLMLTRGGADSVSLSPFFPPVSARAARVTRNLPPCLLSFIYFFYWFGRFDSLECRFTRHRGNGLCCQESFLEQEGYIIHI